jgi:hypothetical protein
VLVAAGLHRLCVPEGLGGLGATLAEASEVLLALGAIDGATALGFAMQVHVTGALRDGQGAVEEVRDRLFRAVVAHGALVNNAATEEGGGSPARGAIPGTVARQAPDGTWRLTGEKTWTTWLPNLTHAAVTARIEDREPVAVGRFLVALDAAGVHRLEGFEALGMRGSASGRLRLEDAPGEVLVPAGPVEGAPRDPAATTWFQLAIAAVNSVWERGRARMWRAGPWTAPRGRVDRSRGPADGPPPARPPRRGAARGTHRRARRRLALGCRAVMPATPRSPSSSRPAPRSRQRTRRCASPAAPASSRAAWNGRSATCAPA